MENTNEMSGSGLVGKEVPAMWILWSYVEMYQTDGSEFKGAH
jgi:hypothetical protein